MTFGIKQEADELSASLTSNIDTMDDENRNTEATGKPPSDKQASTSVVSPYSSGKGIVAACLPTVSASGEASSQAYSGLGKGAHGKVRNSWKAPANSVRGQKSQG